jgi:hydroxypyruvate isomerase
MESFIETILKNKMKRKQVLKTLAASVASAWALPVTGFSTNRDNFVPLKGNINHSVSQWCYGFMPLEELVLACKEIGLKSVELLTEKQWPVALKHGLTCAMGYGTDLGLSQGFNNPALHEKYLKDYSASIPKAAQDGLKNLICFSGNTNGLTPAQGLENCARGLEPIVKLAARHNITICMELLNSKVDHKDYQCDRTSWGVQLCEKLGLDNFKLLYDIYHMQIMEGDVIATIKANAKYIGHYHTAGVPGRHEIDETQELNYPAIMRAIVATGFKGFVGQEFVPTEPDKLGALRKAVMICDV